MKLLRKLTLGLLVAGLTFTISTSTTTAAYIPLEGAMSPQDPKSS
jgi:hypothetical protein